jgi:hypothetical protein
MPSPQHASSPYASPDPGFSALSINELLAQHTELIARIKLCHGSDRATFDQSSTTSRPKPCSRSKVAPVPGVPCEEKSGTPKSSRLKK